MLRPRLPRAPFPADHSSQPKMRVEETAMLRTTKVSGEGETLHQTPFWNLVMDPTVSSTEFKKIHRQFFEHREELSRLRGRSISRREFTLMSASLATTFGLATLIGSATVSKGAVAQTSK